MPLRTSYQGMPGYMASMKMLITRTEPEGCHIRIRRKNHSAWIYTTPSTRKIVFPGDGELTKLLKNNAKQLQSILSHKKRKLL